MPDSYSLTRSQARACRIVGSLFIVTAALLALTGLVLSFSDAASDAICTKPDCGYYDNVLDMLPSEAREKVDVSPAVAARLSAHIEDWRVYTPLDIMATIETLPMLALLCFVGIAQLRLGARQGDVLARALPWLRHAAWAAMAMALLSPILTSLRVMLLIPAVDGYRSWYFSLDLGEVGANLMLAFAALSVSWALSAGSRAQADIAEIV
ncbi:hypothetical protein QLH51_10320 [Sphingomonas sp. 2R-10]|uniref:hypothetical protein n=1 Tax=Sphingomonas sp. 2R-10 TaxID=3045148 RepID=UPI000F770761|nr:hypothetical protein [Sphingomonas sp. 2R-10]MDJ0277188.1 hypothetical protein [Sphingomonas sp. 2R-10]